MEDIKKTLILNLQTTQQKIGILNPATKDELFDFLLTFFEELNLEHKEILKTISLITNPQATNAITQQIFFNYISTPYDTLTLNILFIHLIYTWQNDFSADLSTLTHKINTLVQNIY